MDWDAIRQWFFSFGEKYGVNPIIFGVIYVGAIPFFFASMAWLVKNIREGKSFILPMILTGFFFISAYLYLIIAGKNVPIWVYFFLVALIVVSGWSTYKKIHGKVREEPATES
jgi:hypothetical protein